MVEGLGGHVGVRPEVEDAQQHVERCACNLGESVGDRCGFHFDLPFRRSPSGRGLAYTAHTPDVLAILQGIINLDV